MISHKHRCVFVHVPKTAGKSIETYFLDLHGLTWRSRAPLLLRKNDAAELGPPRLAHLKAHEYCKYHYLSEELFSDYFKFSFVRNPWSRAVSFFRYFDFDLVVSFPRFVEQELPRLATEKSWFFGPQYDFIYHENHQLVDFIGRLERIEEDFNEVCGILNVPIRPLQRLKASNSIERTKVVSKIFEQLKRNPHLVLSFKPEKTRSTDYRAYYNDRSVDAVGALYGQDAEVFGYSFEG